MEIEHLSQCLYYT